MYWWHKKFPWYERIMQALPYLLDYESGSFIDLRQILAPEEYAELMSARNNPDN